MKKAEKIVKRLFMDLNEIKEKSASNPYITPFAKDTQYRTEPNEQRPKNMYLTDCSLVWFGPVFRISRR